MNNTARIESNNVFDPLQPTLTSEDGKATSEFADLARGLAYSAFQNPISGVSQIVDKTTGSNITSSVQLIDKPADTKFGSFQWHTQQIASAVGTTIPFLACFALTKNISRAVQAEELALSFGLGSASATASAFRTAEIATAGFMQAAVLEPNQHQNKFLQERLTQGITAGVTFGSMHAMSNKLSEFTGASAKNASLLNKSLTTGLAGAGGGIVGLAVHQTLTGEKLSTSDTAESIYQAAFVGATLGGMAGVPLRLHQPKSSLPNLESYVSKNDHPSLFESEYLTHHNEKSTSFRSVLTRFGMSKNEAPLSPLEKIELIGLLQRDSDPLLSRPETMNAFVGKIKETWSDKFEQTQTDYNAAWERVHALSDALDAYRLDGLTTKQNNRDFAGLKRLHKKSLEIVDQKYGELTKSVEEHRTDLEVAINEFLTEHKLPKVEVTVDYDPASKSSASYRDGKMQLKDRLLMSKQSEPELINSIYHELTHLRQDVLHIMLLADRLGLPQNPTSIQAELVKAEYKRIRDKSFEPNNREREPEPSNFAPNYLLQAQQREYKLQIDRRADRLIDDILHRRSESPLTAAEHQLALEASKGVATYSEQNYVKGWQTIDTQLDNLHSFAHRPYPELVNRVLNDVLTNPEQLKKEFGFETIPNEIKQLAQSHNSNPRTQQLDRSSAETSGTVSEQQQVHYDQLIEKVRSAFSHQIENLSLKEDKLKHLKAKRYYENTLEQQAFPTGILAEVTAAANGK